VARRLEELTLAARSTDEAQANALGLGAAKAQREEERRKAEVNRRHERQEEHHWRDQEAAAATGSLRPRDCATALGAAGDKGHAARGKDARARRLYHHDQSCAGHSNRSALRSLLQTSGCGTSDQYCLRTPGRGKGCPSLAAREVACRDVLNRKRRGDAFRSDSNITFP
jgi:hypothetical protein